MKNSFILLFLYLVLFYFSGCNNARPQEESTDEPVTLTYAKGFKASRGKGYWVLEVTQPWTGSDRTFRYLVLDENTEKPAGTFDAVVQLPVNKVILTSTTHIPHLDLLDATEKLIGFPQTDLISSEKARKLIDGGNVKELGAGPRTNPELIIDLEPDWLMISTTGEDLNYLDLFEVAKVPAVINGEYVEQHPLGRAEWIKFTGILLGRYEETKEVFDRIEMAYHDAEALTRTIPKENHPTVLSGVMYQDIWYAPGSQSWGALILRNAGGNYVFGDQGGTGSAQLNYEFVLDSALEAEFWIGSSDYSDLQTMGKAEPRYRAFSAFKSGNVFTYTQKRGAKGGLEYFELGYMRPDLILKDLIRILHPELLPEHELYFYRQLDEKK